MTVLDLVKRRILFAEMWVRIYSDCEFLGLSRRYAGQRFRRWKEKQLK